jgi:hypothetical protein
MHYVEFQSQEAPLPHSARSIVFLDKDTACFAYSPTEYAIFSIPTMTAVDIMTPLPVTGSGTAMNALTGLTGYMTLGLGAKAKPGVIRVTDSEFLIAKDGKFVTLFMMRTMFKNHRPGFLHRFRWQGNTSSDN